MIGLLFSLFSVIVTINCGYLDEFPELRWCTLGRAEQQKCEDFQVVIDTEVDNFRYYMRVSCKQAYSQGECMKMLDVGEADVMVVDAGVVFLGGRYHSLIPIMNEVYEGGAQHYYAVAVVKRGSLPDVRRLEHLRGKKVCFSDVRSLAGWAFPISRLMQKGIMEVIDCNNHVKSAMNFFGEGCAPNCLTDKFNPLGDNSHQFCSLCAGEAGQKCFDEDPYAGYEGAFRCLINAGDIAFLKHTTVLEMTTDLDRSNGTTLDDFELLCLDGSRRSVSDYEECHWGVVPAHAVMTTSAKTEKERRYIQKFLQEAVDTYGRKSDFYSTPDPFGRWAFNLFMSGRSYGNKYNLMFQDTTEALNEITYDQQYFKNYLGTETMNHIMEVRHCPVKSVRLCVTSTPEHAKCVRMRTALRAQLLKPEMSCVKAHNHMECMQFIYKGEADVAMMDAGDIYYGGQKYQLIPIVAEQYNLDTPEYYAVAVTQQADQDTDILYLRGKTTCHTGLGMGAGWVMPMAFLINNYRVRGYECDAVKAAGLFFSKSCVPGAMNWLYNHGSSFSNLCDLCHGASNSFCRRSTDEDFFGYTGAFRCLVEGGGNIAFVKHTTVTENTDGKRRDFWSRNQLTEDYELICMDGNRALIGDYEDCNLGKVKSNALMTRGGAGYNQTEINAYLNLFMYAQQFYGQRYGDDFSFRLFYSDPPYWDLIFQDASQQLIPVDPEEYDYRKYLGPAFLQAMETVDCTAGSGPMIAVSPTSRGASLVGALLTTLVLYFLTRL